LSVLDVSALARPKERDVTPVQGRKTDRRVARTQKHLKDALHSLIHERDYDSIAVKEILDRADVGRSAFYMHFRDKDELLVSAFHDILGVPSARRHSSERPEERLLWFSLPVFEHLNHLRHVDELKLGAKGRAVLHGHLERAVTGLIEEEVKRLYRARRKTAGQIPSALLVRYIASTFILVLNWWVENGCPLAPSDVHTLFRTLVAPTLNEAADQR
jgi:AcrR family transcriptional regulator